MSEKKKRILELYERFKSIEEPSNKDEVDELIKIIEETNKLLLEDKMVKLENGKFLIFMLDGFIELEEIL